jgi:chromosome segregation ATPase
LVDLQSHLEKKTSTPRALQMELNILSHKMKNFQKDITDKSCLESSKLKKAQADRVKLQKDAKQKQKQIDELKEKVTQLEKQSLNDSICLEEYKKQLATHKSLEAQVKDLKTRTVTLSVRNQQLETKCATAKEELAKVSEQQKK